MRLREEHVMNHQQAGENMWSVPREGKRGGGVKRGENVTGESLTSAAA